MAWIESHQKLREDPKMIALSGVMGWTEYETIGRLHCLWWWCVDHCPDGDLTRLNDALIARAAGVAAPDAKRFVVAMKTGVCDGDSFFETTPHFRIRNWWKFAGKFMAKRYERDPKRLAELRNRCGTAAEPLRQLPNNTEQNRTQPRRLNDAKPGEHPEEPTAKTPNRSSLNRSKEKQIMGDLRELLGEDEMARAGGHWRMNHVRKHPDRVERGIAELRMKIIEGSAPDNCGAWLEDLMKRWT